jgi:hypothetical protein
VSANGIERLPSDPAATHVVGNAMPSPPMPSPLPDPSPAPSPERRLARISRVARWLDSRWRIPGTTIGFGLDSLFGLVPVVGDVLPAAASLWIVEEARRAGARRPTLVRMLANVGLDVVVGSVPVLGDLFDVAWKANRRNAELLRADLYGGPGDGPREVEHTVVQDRERAPA